jgi:tRNA dimethylallyltransferase
MVKVGSVKRADGLVIAVVGPTAAGKSALSLALAHELGGEVVNADSMQLYRGMDIGTAKLTGPQREGIPHHVLDIWDLTATASVAEYQRLARAAVGDVLARGRVPLLVGGSALYVWAVLDELDSAGGTPTAWPAYRSVRLAIDREPAALDERIAVRVDGMWAAGLVDEVRGLAGRGLREGRTARAALGYQQVLAYLAGGITETGAHAETIRATRRFVRRQRAWFGRDPDTTWLDGDRPDLPGAALAVIKEATEG